MADSGAHLLDGRYRLESRIAAGGFGEVWRAADTVLARPVAIKLLHAGLTGQPEILDRFRAEARNAGALSHENIARVYDYGEPDPPRPPFLVMELIEGPSLATVLVRGPLEAARTLDIVAQVAAGLQAAHQAGLVHRDIKPGNLLLGPGGQVKVTDFGISRAAGAAPVTSTGVLVGTPSYLAPERAAGGSATPVSDLYSLGMMAYECLAGRPPFAGTALEIALAHRDHPLPPLPAAIPAAVAAFVARLTAKDPAARPPSAADASRQASLLRDQVIAGTRLDAPAVAADLSLAAPGRQAATVAGRPTTTLASPGGPSRRAARGRLALTAVVAIPVGLAGLVLASAASPGRAPAQAAVPSSTSSAMPPTFRLVSVRGSALAGYPASVVAARLRRLGLTVRVLWQVSRQQRPGMVLSVSPDGRLSMGTLVTVTGAVAPRAQPLPVQKDHLGHGDGRGGSGSGDGQGGNGG